MFRPLAALAILLGIGFIGTVQAGDRYESYAGQHGYAYSPAGYGKHDRHYSRYSQPLSLSFKVRLNGDSTVRLRRMIEDRYGIDTRQYRLRSVAVGNKARYGACAELITGRYSTGPIDLYRGSNQLHSAAGQRGKWVLHLDDARVRRIRVELEPLYQQHAYRRGGEYRRGYDYR